MKIVKFSGNDPVQKQFASALRKNVHEYFAGKNLSVKATAAMYFKAIVMLTLYIALFVFLLTMPMGWGFALLLIILMGIGEAGIGMSVMHEAAHGSFSGKKWINRLLASTMYMLGSNTFNWKVQHNLLHHRFTNIYGFDQDIETHSVIRLSDHAPLKKFHRFQHRYTFFLYGLMTLSKLVTDFGQLMDFNKSGITLEQNHDPVKENVKLFFSKVIYLSIIIGLPWRFTNFSWWQILTGFSILHVTAGMIMSTVFQMAHVVLNTMQPLPNAKGIIENEWAVHQMNAIADFARNNLFLNWYIGGLNFQVEHHLFPNVSHIHYRKISPIVERTAHEFGVSYNCNATLTDALVSHFRKLKALGTIQHLV
ncbi:MAG: fatty acid desaturase family protein [Bacteroidia bacterium]